jgi:hypothetical protein
MPPSSLVLNGKVSIIELNFKLNFNQLKPATVRHERRPASAG